MRSYRDIITDEKVRFPRKLKKKIQNNLNCRIAGYDSHSKYVFTLPGNAWIPVSMFTKYN